jgi:predicted RNase H-like HicB family nuclease
VLLDRICELCERGGKSSGRYNEDRDGKDGDRSVGSNATARYAPFMTVHAVVKRDGPLWIGWVEEYPGVNSQGATREELLENLASALREAVELNREESLASAGTDYEEIALSA